MTRIVALALAGALLLLPLSACGKKGDPMPPKPSATALTA